MTSNPAAAIPILEQMRAEETSLARYARADALSEAIGALRFVAERKAADAPPAGGGQ